MCECMCNAVHSAVQAAWEMCRVDRNTAVRVRLCACVYVCVHLCACATSCSCFSQTLVIFITRDSSLSLYMLAALLLLLLHVSLFSLSSEHLGSLHLTFDLGTMWKPPACMNSVTHFSLCSGTHNFPRRLCSRINHIVATRGQKQADRHATLANYCIIKLTWPMCCLTIAYFLLQA